MGYAWAHAFKRAAEVIVHHKKITITIYGKRTIGHYFSFCHGARIEFQLFFFWDVSWGMWIEDSFWDGFLLKMDSQMIWSISSNLFIVISRNTWVFWSMNIISLLCLQKSAGYDGPEFIAGFVCLNKTIHARNSYIRLVHFVVPMITE